MLDMTRCAGDGAGIKAITGGDKVSINPKYKAPYSTRIPAVVLAVIIRHLFPAGTKPNSRCASSRSQKRHWLPLAAHALQSARMVPVLPAWRLPDRVLYAARFIPLRVRSIIDVIEQLLPEMMESV